MPRRISRPKEAEPEAATTPQPKPGAKSPKSPGRPKIDTTQGELMRMALRCGGGLRFGFFGTGDSSRHKIRAVGTTVPGHMKLIFHSNHPCVNKRLKAG